jgi:hypothetical protein
MDQTSKQSYTDMENTQLKQIIRENECRIYYLERKLNLATNYINYLEQYLSEKQHHNICYSCRDTYLYDEIVCDCNMFCGRSLCKSCYSTWKKEATPDNDIQLCQETRCTTWNCERTGGIYLCKECDKKLCLMHYHEKNIDIQNWICIQCCEKTKLEYGYESV